MFTFSIIFAFLVSLIASAISIPLILPIIKKWGLIDNPKKHKHPALLHKKPIPRGGGIALFIGVLVASLLFLPMSSGVTTLLFAAFIALVTGTLDDKYDLSPYLRLFTNIVVALIVVTSGVSFPHFITNPFGGILHLDIIKISFTLFTTHIQFSFAEVLALLWIIWVMNMLNWSKGVDGQMPGVIAISAIVIGILSLRYSLLDPSTYLASHLSFIIAGAAIGFLLFNFYPAKIFPGYGATAIYLLLAATSLIASAKLATAILVMGIPMIDGIFTIARRIASGKSPFWGDRKHLHHLLLDLGYSQRTVALFYWLVSAILGIISLTLSSRGKLFAIVMLVIILGGGLLFLHRTIQKQKDE